MTMTLTVANAEPAAVRAPCTSHVSVRLGGVDHDLVCPAGTTLLEAALAAGLAVPHSCREGHCGACMAMLRAGAVASDPSTVLSRRDRLQRRILCCRSRPTTAFVTIDYDS